MPVNFNIDFTIPMTTAIEQKSFPDIASYAEEIVELYAKALEKGFPQNIPPTLPAPSLSGNPGPVGTGPGDAYKMPTVDASKKRMQLVIDKFYTIREIVLQEGDIEAKKQIILNAIRKAEYQAILLKNQIETAKQLGIQLKELPIRIKDAFEGVKALVERYVEEIKNVKNDILEFSIGQEISELTEGLTDEEGKLELERLFKEKFPTEAQLINTLTSIKLTDIGQIANGIRAAKQYIQQSQAFGLGGNIGADPADGVQFNAQDASARFAQDQLNKTLVRLTKLGAGIAAPESLGGLINDLKKDIQSTERSLLGKLDRAIAASDQIKVLKVFVQPKLKELETFIKGKKKKIEDDLKKTTETVQEEINKTSREVAEKKLKIKKKGPSKAKQRFKQAADKAKDLKDDVEKIVAVNAKRFGIATNIITETINIANTALELQQEIEGIIVEDFNKIKEEAKKFETAAEALKSVEPSSQSIIAPATAEQIEKFISDLRLDVLKKIPGFVDVIKDSGISLVELKKFVLESPPKYKNLYKKVIGFQPQLNSLETSFKDLRATFNNPNKVPKQTKPKPKKSRKPVELNPTLKNILDAIKKLIDNLNNFRIKVQNDLAEWVKKQAEKLEDKKDDITNALIDSLPIPASEEAKANREQSAKEKLNAINNFKTQALQIKKRTEAVISLSRHASTLSSNIGKGDFSAAKNETPLREVGKAKFNFFTVGVSATSAKYKEELAFLNTFNKEVDTLKEIETYVTLFNTLRKELKSKKIELKEGLETRAVGVVEKIKQDYRSIAEAAQQSATNFNEEGVRGVSPIIDKLLSTLEVIFGGKVETAQDLIKELKTLNAIAEGNILSETLKSQPLIMAFKQIEDKYLLETKKVLQRTIGIVPLTQEEEEELGGTDEAIAELLGITVEEVKREKALGKKPKKIGQSYSMILQPKSTPPSANKDLVLGPLASSLQFARDQRENAKKAAAERIGNSKLFSKIVDLYEALVEGKGSFIAMLIEKLVKLINKFEAFIKGQISNVIVAAKKKIKKLTEKNKEDLENKLENVKKRTDILDIIATATMLQIATQAFWLGASWQNSVGTTFQVIAIKPGKIVKTNTKKEGYNQYYRDMGESFQKQLSGVVGIAIPNPSLGIPPFFWKGYA